MNLSAKLIATFLGIGYCPVWPGAAGSAAALAVAWLLPPDALPWAFAIATVSGFWACEPSIRLFGRKDPQTFVMDEVAGMFLTLLFLPKTTVVLIAGYFLFRFFDAAKPWPISIIQKKDHSWAIMWDDLAAGAASNLLLQIGVYFFLKSGGSL